MKVVYCGQFTDSSGYGSAARGYLSALDASGVEFDLKVHNVAFEGTSKISDQNKNLIHKYSFKDVEEIREHLNSRDYILIWHLPAPSFFVHLQRHKEIAHTTNMLVRGAKRVINLAAWEYDKIPMEWKRTWRDLCFDATISPSRWNQEVFSQAFTR